MITVMTPGQYRVTAPDGALIGMSRGTPMSGFRRAPQTGEESAASPRLPKRSNRWTPISGNPFGVQRQDHVAR